MFVAWLPLTWSALPPLAAAKFAAVTNHSTVVMPIVDAFRFMRLIVNAVRLATVALIRTTFVPFIVIGPSALRLVMVALWNVIVYTYCDTEDGVEVEEVVVEVVLVEDVVVEVEVGVVEDVVEVVLVEEVVVEVEVGVVEDVVEVVLVEEVVVEVEEVGGVYPITVPAEMPLLPIYCELPANDAVIVTAVFCPTVGAVYVTDDPVVEDRVPTPAGLIDQVTVMPLNALPELSLTLAVMT
jgi:hypothetical protein